MLLDASWGLGPAVVDGTVTPDEFVLGKKPEIHLLEQRLSDKTVLLEGQNNLRINHRNCGRREKKSTGFD